MQLWVDLHLDIKKVNSLYKTYTYCLQHQAKIMGCQSTIHQKANLASASAKRPKLLTCLCQKSFLHIQKAHCSTFISILMEYPVICIINYWSPRYKEGKVHTYQTCTAQGLKMSHFGKLLDVVLPKIAQKRQKTSQVLVIFLKSTSGSTKICNFRYFGVSEQFLAKNYSKTPKTGSCGFWYYQMWFFTKIAKSWLF